MTIVLLIFATLSVNAEVIMRYFFNRPTMWVMETSEWTLLFITFLGAAWVLKREGHIRMDLLITRLNPRASAILNSITSILCAATMLVVAWYAVEATWDTLQRGVLTYGRLELPIYFVTAVIAVGSFLLSAQFLRRSYGYLKSARSLPDKERKE